MAIFSAILKIPASQDVLINLIFPTFEAGMKEKTKNISLHPELWVKNYGDLLFNYTIAKVLSAEVAEDLVQETFLSALKSKDNFRGNSTEKTWLIAILKRKIIDYYRKKTRDNKIITEDYPSPFHSSGANEGSWIESRAPAEWDMKALDGDDEFMKIFKYCLSLLSPKAAAVFSLKNIEDCSSDEICKELDVSLSNVWVLLHRAKLKLRDCIEKRWKKS